jgi:hypothetical protein
MDQPQLGRAVARRRTTHYDASMVRSATDRSAAGPRTSADRRYDLLGQIIDGIFSLGRWAIVCGTAILVFYFLRDVFLAYAGQSTLANVAISVVTDVRIEAVISYTVGGGGVLYGLRQRQLRQRNIERLTARILVLEREKDPYRSSSGLTPRGTTRPSDR